MDLIQKFKEKAKKIPKTIVLPEGEEERTIKASGIILKEQLANLVLLGNIENIKKKAEQYGVDISKAKLINPKESDLLDKYSEEFYNLRKAKGITQEEARKTIQDTVYFGTMMVHLGDADGLVSGAEHSTANTIRPALQIIKTKPGTSIVSSAFIMIVPNCNLGENGLFVFADCAVNPDPTAEQLAEIAISTANTAKILCDIEPRVALLSFSTKGSAQHPLVEKVQKATQICKEKAPDLLIDGELQADAALITKVGEKKAPGSPVAGKANTLIFPDLQSGNIGYKLVQRLAGAEAIGPFLQGMNKPVNDLSRGCSIDDIVNVVTVTAVQAQDN